MRLAANKAPGTISKQHRGKPSSRKSFKVWTVSALLERYQDPRAILLEIASTPTAQLAEQMNASLADALAERRLCAQAVLPYVAQKLPVQVDMRHTKAIHLNIVDDRQYAELVEVAAAEDDADSFNMTLLPSARSDDVAGSDRPAMPDTDTEAGSDRPVTPPMAASPTGEEER